MINEDLLKVINEYTKFTHDTNINKKQIVEELSSLVFIEDDELLLENIDYFFDFINIKRENCWSFNKIQDNAEELIKHVENKEQPEQRTDEWYKYRYNMLTASSIWKIFKSESTRKELIKNKKEPLNLDKYKKVNTESPLHWGHKYEPLSTMIYEKQYDTIIKEFGCITHDNYDFLGASPDGLNIKYGNPRYGRLLEIKNPTTRKITGIPKKEYWVQMQLQMEVWDFNYVDFLETSFKEYNNEDEFLKDGTFTLTNDNKMKGIIIQFQDNNNNPYYEYMPIGFTRNEYENWYETIFKKNEEKNYIWITTSYWRLDDISCVLVPRNKKWFNYALPQFRSLWDIIKKERVSGSEHRAPKRKAKSKIPKSPPVTFKFSTESFDEIMFDENELEL